MKVIERKTVNRLFLGIAMAIVILNLAIMFVSIPTKAVTSNGFVDWDEVNPANKILFSTADTGLGPNPVNYPIGGCCAVLINANNEVTRAGPLFASNDSRVFNYNGNISGGFVQVYGFMNSSFGGGQITVTYNNTNIYATVNAMGYAPADDKGNNYPYAIFTEDLQPVNQVAEEFLAFVANNAVEPDPPPQNSSLNYSLPAGNVAYIEIGSGTLNFAELDTIMPIKSAAFSADTGWSSTQRIGFSETLPSNGQNLAAFGSQIQWQKTGNTNIFGQTQNANYLAANINGHKYLVIVNPLYYAIQYTNGEGIANTEAGVQSTVNNNAIDINVQSASAIKVYQLTQTVTINNNIPSYNNDITSGPYEGDIDPDTGDVTWTDPDGGSSQPTTGGGNVPGTGENNFSSFISGVANKIVNVFQPAHDAILTLSNAVQNISGWLYALYIWLPAPVLSLLTSAISLAIIIGLIKVFV